MTNSDNLAISSALLGLHRRLCGRLHFVGIAFSGLGAAHFPAVVVRVVLEHRLRHRVRLLGLQQRRVREYRVLEPVVGAHLDVQVLHDEPHHLVALAVDLERRVLVLGRPLQVHDVHLGPLALGPVHGPQPRVLLQHLEAGAEAEDHVGLLGVLAGAVPVERPPELAALAEVHDRVDQRPEAEVAAPVRAVVEARGQLGGVEQPPVLDAGLALRAHLDEHVAVHLRERLPRQPGAQVQPVAVLRQRVVQDLAPVQLVERHVRERRLGQREVVLADLLALLQQRPDALAAAVVGDARRRADAGAGVADQVLRPRQHLRQLARLRRDDVRRVLLLQHALLRVGVQLAPLQHLPDDVGARLQLPQLVGRPRQLALAKYRRDLNGE